MSAEQAVPPVSVVTGHFPEIRFEEGARRLWNPVRRNLLADRPEERVRLQLAEWLHLSCGQPVSRFTTELPVKRRIAGDTLRTDLLCYDAQHRPWLLAECKAPEVPLTRQTALQASRYNLEIGAPLVLLTNGRRDLFFEVSGDGITPASLSALETGLPVNRDAAYWQRRGFLGRKPLVAEASHFAALLCLMQQQAGPEIHLIKIPQTKTQPELNHYFFIIQGRALTISADENGGSRLQVLDIRQQQVAGHLSLPLHTGADAGGPASITRNSGSRILAAEAQHRLVRSLTGSSEPDACFSALCSELDAVFG